jgi:hypothetical protein
MAEVLSLEPDPGSSQPFREPTRLEQRSRPPDIGRQQVLVGVSEIAIAPAPPERSIELGQRLHEGLRDKDSSILAKISPGVR